MKHLLLKLALMLLAILLPATATASPITLQQAQQNALSFLESKGKSISSSSLRQAQFRLTSAATESYYVFNIGHNEGYVIAAGDDCAPAILGYADAGYIDVDSMPVNLQSWLEEYAQQIQFMQENGFASSNAPQLTSSYAVIPPLMTTTWDQQDPYNQNCPDFFSYGKCVTGCVATAMAQVMYYHRANSVAQTTAQIPAYDCRTLWLNGTDTLGHIHVDAIPAGSPIDWSNMLDSYSGSATTTQKQAVANLMKYCGAAVQMNYANAWSGGSGAYSSDVPIALKSYFNYSDQTTLEYRSDYPSDDAWESLVYNELSSSRPVYYSGRNNSAGHAFVCDGYDGSGYYHINWGWSGTSDGYFLLTALDPDQQGTGGSSSGYNQNQAALINAQPKSSSPSNPVLATSISLNNTSAELNTGETLQLTATVLPSNATNKTVTWTTSNSSVATVNSNGLVTAKAVGNVTITARTTDGSNLSASCSVTVKQSSVLATSISLNKTSAEINTGGTLQLTATVLPTNATNKTVTWSTSNSSVATVNSNGLVTGHSTGSATITARTTDGTDLSAYCSITVKQNTQSNIISFADANVKALCVQNWDTNGDGELSTSEAAVVTSLGTVFKFNKSITSFNELVYFTGLNSIGNDAFEFCSGLTSITIPESVTSIGSSAFNYCSGLTSITIPSSMTNIGSYAFDNCSGLTSITIPSSVTSIGDAAFSYCESISSITVSSNNTVYDSRGNCNAIIKKSNNELIVGCKNTVIPSSVTSIGNSAFSGCHGMTSITIPSSVKSIGRNAFTWCSSLTSISIPSSVTSIESTAFDGCAGLSSITVSSNNTVYDSRDNCNAIIKKSNNVLIQGCKNTVFPSSVTGIGEYAFFGCTSITSITIPSNVTSIGEEAFTRCDYLASVTIPSTMISIGNYAFSLCFRLTSVTCLASIPPTIGNAYTFYHPDKATLYVPAGKKSAYQNADYWKEFSQIIELPVLATSISLNKTSAELIEGNTMQLTATVLPSNATNKTVTWTTSNSSVATVNSNGLVTAKAVGNATITARTTDGSNLSASCSVTVKQSSVLATSISLNKTSAEINTGGTLQLTATVLPSNATNKTVTWSTSNSTVATVNSNGLVTAKSPGNATITATTTDGSNLSASCAVNVVVPVTSISLDKTSAELVKGNAMKLIVTVLPSNATNKVVTWSSSNPTIASVDDNGLVTALAAGFVTITAMTTDGSNLSASCNVTVTENLSNYDNYLSMSDVDAFRGDTIVIPVKMTNESSIISFQTDIFLPEGIELLQEDGEYLIDPSERMTRTHSIMSNKVSNGSIRVLCYSSNYKPFTGNSGDDLFYLTVKVADDAEGDYTIQLKNTLLTNSDFVDLAAPDVAANVNVKAYLLGDANNSGTVTITDVVVTAQYVLERNPDPFIVEAADVNIDGNITVTDVTRIAWIVLNPTLNAPRQAPALWDNGDHMSGEGINLAAGETQTVSIALDNDRDYSAFQFDLTFPEGLTASHFQLTDRAGSHAFDVNALQNGSIRALCYSPVMTCINGHQGALLTFDVTATGTVNGDITVDGIELVTPNCNSVQLDGFTIVVNNATGMNETSIVKTVARMDYYNLAGQRLDRPESGVILVVTSYTDGTRVTSRLIKR